MNSRIDLLIDAYHSMDPPSSQAGVPPGIQSSHAHTPFAPFSNGNQLPGGGGGLPYAGSHLPPPPQPLPQGVYPQAHALQQQQQQQRHIPRHAPAVHFAPTFDQPQTQSPQSVGDGSVSHVVSAYMEKIAHKDSHIAQLSLRLSELERKLADVPTVTTVSTAPGPLLGDTAVAPSGEGGQAAAPGQIQVPVPDVADEQHHANGSGGGDGGGGGGAGGARNVASNFLHESSRGRESTEWHRNLDAQIQELREQVALCCMCVAMVLLGC